MAYMNLNIYDTSKHTVLLNGDYLTFQLEPIDLNTVEMVILSPTTVPTIINMQQQGKTFHIHLPQDQVKIGNTTLYFS